MNGTLVATLRVRIIPIDEMGTSHLSYHIRLDNQPPESLRTEPANGSWLSHTQVSVSVLALDAASGISPASQRYAIYRTIEDVTEVQWVPIDPSSVHVNGSDCSIELRLTLDEGHHHVLWNISDAVGNYVIVTHEFSIDTKGITFTDFRPGGWQNTASIESSITISDANGSGIKGSSIKYSISTGEILDFSEWTEVGQTTDRPVVTVHVNFTGREGTNNAIRFQGSDVAGNPVMTSPTYYVWIDTIAPEVLINDPGNDSTIGPSDRYVNVTVIESISGEITFNPVLTDAENGSQIEVQFTWVRTSDGTFHYQMWWETTGVEEFNLDIECLDMAMNTGKVTGHRFRINKPPIVDIESPKDRSTRYSGDEILFVVSCHDPDGDALSVMWYLDVDEVLSEDLEFRNSTLPTGRHVIKVVVDDGIYTVTDEMELTIRKNDVRTDPAGIVWIIIVAALILCGVLLWMARKRLASK
jgi:hypothetical protein